MARDAAFDKVLTDARVTSSESKVLAQPAAAGDYYIRISAVNADGLKAKPALRCVVRVARVTVLSGSEGRRASVAVEGKDLFCGLDGGPLSAVADPLPLSPAREHTLRCATVAQNARPEESAQQVISATQSGPLVSRVEPGAVSFTQTEGQRQVTLVLSDAAGTPVTGANVTAGALAVYRSARCARRRPRQLPFDCQVDGWTDRSGRPLSHQRCRDLRVEAPRCQASRGCQAGQGRKRDAAQQRRRQARSL